jgi:KDO2-lipid IV(A) lauroyltransferase
VPLFCLRQKDNRYKVWAEPMLILSDDGKDSLVENTQNLTDIIEVAIRKDVTQWFWMHKRWRVKPDTNKG